MVVSEMGPIVGECLASTIVLISCKVDTMVASLLVDTTEVCYYSSA
jgi:hypothetical protein